MNLIDHLRRQHLFSMATFGPGARTLGICEHIRRELVEIEASDGDLEEWIDVVILALDGALRSQNEPEEIVRALEDKQAKNERRKWTDWRTLTENDPIEHVRDHG